MPCKNLKTAVMTENERELCGRNLKERVVSGEIVLADARVSTSNQAAKDSAQNCSKGKDVLQASEAEQLSERLEILEQETQTMEQAFFKTMDERRRLVSELHQQFRVIHHCLHLQNQHTANISSSGSFSFNLDELTMERIGSAVRLNRVRDMGLVCHKFYAKTQVHE
ncbi:hypothetical protein CFOL_v3_29227 [Cephalotus follicularis]|uniref:Uncharacterized protein n=1 Tax=Cephalotus follicularis TaxID=3775 RepID=A0A1Q3D0G8_CEPFO|nr:hypothetical protein CFOL_v3_29227 [Cephalotus follicularis]